MLADTAARATLDGRTTVGVSWMTAIGRAPGAADDAPLMVLPVLETPASLGRTGFDLTDLIRTLDRSWTLHRRSDWQLGDALTEVVSATDAAALLDSIPWPGLVGYPSGGDALLASSPKLQSWIRTLGRAAGWHTTRVTGRHPHAVMTSFDAAARAGDMTVCVGFAILPVAERTPSGSAGALLAWAGRAGIESTAFATLVGDGDEGAPHTDDAAPDPVSHVQLTAAQRRVAAGSRHAPVTVVSGAPGTGKTHTIAAICADAVARGESVLIATRTIEAASVIADLLGRQPGPVPLRFGSPESIREAFAEIDRRLANPGAAGTHLASEAQTEFVALTEEVRELLTSLAALEDAAAPDSPRMRSLRRAAGGCFAPGADLDRIHELLTTAERASGWFGTSLGRARRRRAAEAEVRVLAEAPTAPLDSVRDAARTARAQRQVGDAEAIAASLEALWPAWEDAEASYRYWTGKSLDDLTIRRLSSRSARGALTTIGTALRSGPSSRQRLLSTIDRRAFRDAAPIWLGTLGETERLLPPTPSWFDIVVIDEASQVDLALAAPALLRGSRCVVLGDPRQLRHVSFVGDDAMQAAFETAGVDAEVGRLDVRRNSVFDVAAGAAPVDWLDEHHRSLPHLVQFSLDEFYDRAVSIATRYPTTECRDCIDIVDPGADPVRAVIARLRELQAAGATDVGVITPLRDLADRLQEAVLTSLGHEAIEAMRLMVTTVHGFQGAERRHVVVVPGIDADSPAGRRRFVEDRHLFNVMVSRARQRMDVVTAVPPDELTLLGRFVTWSHRPPAPTPDGTDDRPAAAGVAKALVDAGLEVRSAYPVGHHTVDLVVASGERVRGVLCGVHPDGPDAHIERHRDLRLAGWRLVDLVPALDDAGRAARAIEIAGEIRS